MKPFSAFAAPSSLPHRLAKGLTAIALGCGLAACGPIEEGEVFDEPTDGAEAPIDAPVEATEAPLEGYPGLSGPTGQWPLDFGQGPTLVTYEEIGGHRVFEGDIVLDDGEPRPKTAIRGDRVWPGGRVPYDFANALPQARKDRALEAIDEWNAKTVYHLVPKTADDLDWVRFKPSDDGCSSSLGRVGGKQFIYVTDWCTAGNLMHEIGHAIGLYHEQTRADRDEHLNVNWDNIEDGKEHNYQTYVERGMPGVDFGSYDDVSIMHYGSFGFAVDDSIPTLNKAICAPDDASPECLIEKQRDHLTDKDKAAAMRQLTGTPEVTFRLRNVATDTCLRPDGGSMKGGKPLKLYTCNDSESRQWFDFLPDGADAPVLVNLRSRMCPQNVAIDGGLGAALQKACRRIARQAYTRVDRGDGMFQIRVANQCLTPMGSGALFLPCNLPGLQDWRED